MFGFQCGVRVSNLTELRFQVAVSNQGFKLWLGNQARF